MINLLILRLLIMVPIVTWSQYFGEEVFESPAVGDLDQDGLAEIFVFARGHLWCLNYDGTTRWDIADPKFWDPLMNSDPILVNLDNSGDAEILLATVDTLFCFNSAGTVIWRYGASNHRESIGVANIDTAGNAEVIYSLHPGGTLVCLNNNGTEKWVKAGRGGNFAISDIDEDGAPDIVVNTINSIICLNGIDGSLKWTLPFQGDNLGINYPAIADVDNDGDAEIIIRGSSTTPVIYCIEPNGIVKWTYSIGGGNSSGPSHIALADINKDGKTEMVFFIYHLHKIYAIQENSAGTGAVEVWSTPVIDNAGNSCSNPVICDMDADSFLEVLWIGTEDLCIFDGQTGNVQYQNSNFHSGTRWQHGVVIADVDNDNIVELIGIWGDGGIALLEDDANWPTLGLKSFQAGDYHITNIESDTAGPQRMWVPRKEPRHWESHNTWLTQMDYGPPLGVEEPEKSGAYQKKAKDFWTLVCYGMAQLKWDEKQKFCLYDISGKLLTTGYSTEIRYRFPTSGIYFLQLTRKKTVKIINLTL